MRVTRHAATNKKRLKFRQERTHRKNQNAKRAAMARAKETGTPYRIRSELRRWPSLSSAVPQMTANALTMSKTNQPRIRPGVFHGRFKVLGILSSMALRIRR